MTAGTLVFVLEIKDFGFRPRRPENRFLSLRPRLSRGHIHELRLVSRQPAATDPPACRSTYTEPGREPGGTGGEDQSHDDGHCRRVEPKLEYCRHAVPQIKLP